MTPHPHQNSTAASATICAHRALVDRHFAGTIRPDDERRMRVHLMSPCASCRDRYARQRLLTSLDPETSVLLKPEVRIGRALGLSSSTTTSSISWLRPFGSTLFVAVAALILFMIRPSSSSSSLLLAQRDGDGFTARGSQLPPASASSRISVYRIAKATTHTPTLVSDNVIVDRDDELAFTYQNGDETKTHLMIFAVASSSNDDGGQQQQHIYWFHPEWTLESENPTAIRIEADNKPHELREAIRHQFKGMRITIHGLFLDRSLTVREVEEAVTHQENESAPITVPGGIDQVATFEVR